MYLKKRLKQQRQGDKRKGQTALVPALGFVGKIAEPNKAQEPHELQVAVGHVEQAEKEEGGKDELDGSEHGVLNVRFDGFNTKFCKKGFPVFRIISVILVWICIGGKIHHN